jgi:hypothetical protein
MMTIVMYCDHCGHEVDPGVNGGVRVRTHAGELAFHLCAEHQKALRDFIENFCGEDAPRQVGQPTLKTP